MNTENRKQHRVRTRNIHRGYFTKQYKSPGSRQRAFELLPDEARSKILNGIKLKKFIVREAQKARKSKKKKLEGDN